VRVDGDGGRRDQPDAGAVLRGGDHAGQLRCVGELGAQALPAAQPVCGVDRDSIYRCEGVASIAEQLAGKKPQTQFGRAMEQLGVELILANSPQARGLVERMNGVLQDRLVKEMRLAGINDLKSANRFLDGEYLRAFHRRFGRAAASPVDVHRSVARPLNAVLSWEEERVVQADWTVAYGGKRYQPDRQHEVLSLVRRKVIVRTLRDGRVQLVYRGKQLKWRALPERAVRKQAKARPVKTKTGGSPRRRAIRGGGWEWESGGSIGAG